MTVVPNQSPSRSAAGPVWTPTRTGVWEASTIRSPSATAARGSCAAQHHAVAEELDLLGRVLGKQVGDAGAEVDADVGRRIVATLRRKRRISDEVAEKEGLHLDTERYVNTVRYVKGGLGVVASQPGVTGWRAPWQGSDGRGAGGRAAARFRPRAPPVGHEPTVFRPDGEKRPVRAARTLPLRSPPCPRRSLTADAPH